MKRVYSLPEVFPVTCHTDFVGEGSTFVAIQGFAQNGVDYIEKALSKGAKKIVAAVDAVIPETVLAAIKDSGASLDRVDNTRRALARLSADAAGNPAQNLTFIAITGTKGKTTTAWLTHEILRSAGYKVALMSGVCNKINGMEFDAPLTTAQPDYLHQFLKLCVAHKVTHVVIEVAAQALSLHRVEGIMFDAVAFTNFSYEHLEFYKNLEDYFLAKCQIIDFCKPQAPLVLNQDNTWTRRCIEKYQPVVTYGSGADADLQFFLRDEINGLHFDVLYNKRKLVFHVPALIGDYNLYNCAAALALALSLNIEPLDCAYALDSFSGVPGRLEIYKLANGARGVIDYAHTPDSYHAVLSTLRDQTNHLIVIFGAGGKRDKSKRPVMGGIAASYADQVILTSDNPRNEDPTMIVEDIRQGIDEKDLPKVTIELDRKKAILNAYKQTHDGSIIVLLGKGNDEYQIVGDKKSYFSEREILEELM